MSSHITKMVEEDGVIYCDFDLGAGIAEVVELALQIARDQWKEVCFEFNGFTFRVVYHTIADAMVRDYYRALHGLISKTIGPDCEYPLSIESIARDKAMRKN